MNIILGKLAEMTRASLPLLENRETSFKIAKTANAFINNVIQNCGAPAAEMMVYPENQGDYCDLYTGFGSTGPCTGMDDCQWDDNGAFCAEKQ